MKAGKKILKKAPSIRKKHSFSSAGICFEPLEPRLLLSGSWGAGVDVSPAESQVNTPGGIDQETVALHADTGISDQQAWQQQRLQVVGRIDLLASAPALNAFPASETMGASDESAPAGGPTSSAVAVASRELVFVDAGIQNHAQLVDDMLANADHDRVFEVIVLDADGDGIAQISDILADRSDLTAVHFITHGADGQISLGNTRLNGGTLAVRSEAVSGWGDALTENGDFLFYGCNIAAGSTGQALLSEVARLTAADVTASDDATGHVLLGGDWEFEQVVGEIETDEAVSADVQSNWASVLDATHPLLLTTVDDVSNGGQPGTEDWNKGDLLQFADPNLAFAPAATDGTFSTAFDMDLFRSGAPTNAVHYVTADIQLGTSGFQLLAGDLLLSGADGGVNGNSLSVTDPHFSNALVVQRNDVFVFRPDTPGDCSVGSFALLLDDPVGTEIRGLSLIEKDTVVGDVTLEAGDFLFSRKGGAEDNDIWLFSIDDVGASTTSGSATVLIEGDDPGVGIDEKIFGLDLVETTTTIGGRTLTAGTILVAVEKAEGVGPGDALAVTEFDIFALEPTQTTLGSGTGNGLVSASLFFSGGDVDFNDDEEEAIDGFTLTTAHGQAPVIALPSPAIIYVVGATTEIDPAATVTDADSADLEGGTLTISFSSGGTANDNLSILPNGTVTLAGFDVQVSAVTIGTYSGGVAGTDLVITWNTSSTPADIATVLRQIAYANSVGADTSSRTVGFALSDGDGSSSALAQQTINFSGTIAPILTLPNSPSTFTENGPPVIVDTGAFVIDTDSPALDGGTLTVSIETNRGANDLLSVVAGGNVTLIASDVLVSGTIIGTIDAVDDGTAGKDLVIAWNTFSTPAAVQEVLRQIAFSNSSDDPNDLTRTLRVTLTDGDSGTSLPATQQVIVHSVNDQPIGADTTVSTAEDTDYVFTAADFGFSDPAEGDAFNAVKIASLPLLGTLTNNAVAVALNDLIPFSDIDAGLLVYTPPLDGTGSPCASFDFQVQDSGGTAHGGVNLSAVNTMTMNVTNVNDAPTATNLTATSAYNEGDATVAITDIVVGDVDAGETITATLTLNDTSTGSLSANDGATYTTGTGVWTITDTVANVNLALANLIFTPTVNNDVDTTITTHIEDAAGAGPADGTITLDVNPVNDAPAGLPTIIGTASEDQTLTADTTGISDADGLGAFTYQWLRDGLAIGGATAGTHTLGDADVGKQISVQVGYTDGHGTVEGPLASLPTAAVANVNDTGTVTIDNPTPLLGETLTAGVSDADGASGAVSYQWYRDGAAIAGATAAGYTTVQADVGAVITVTVEYTDDLLTVESLTSAGTAAVVHLGDSGTVSGDNTAPPSDGGEPTPPEMDTAVAETETVAEPEAAPLEGVPEAASPPPSPEPVEEAVPRGRGLTHARMAFLAQSRQPSSQTRVGAVTADNAAARQSSRAVKPEKALSTDSNSKRAEERARTHNLMAARAYLNMVNSLDGVKKELAGEIAFNQTVLGSAIAVSTGLSVGYVIWLIRGGMLLSSLLSSIPAWQILDPLPVLAGRKADDESDDDDSLASIIDRKPQEKAAEKKPMGESLDTKEKYSKR